MEILSAKGTKTRRFRNDGRLESIIEGFVEVGCQTPLTPEELTQARLENLCNVPPGYFGIPDGFVRESNSWIINGDGTRVEFRMVDVEQKRPPTNEDDPKPIIVE